MYKNIIVPLDGSELAECVLPHVHTVAKGQTAARVTLIRVVTKLHLYGGVESRFSPEEKKRLEDGSIRVASEYLEKVAARLTEQGLKVDTLVLFGEKTIDTLADYVDKNSVDIIVIATHGRSGVGRWVMGSVAEKILRASPVPVLMVRPKECKIDIA